MKEDLELYNMMTDDEYEDDILKKIDQIEFELLFDKEDESTIYLEIHAGAGGDDAKDWAYMLHNMYIKWIDQRDDLKYSIIDISMNEIGLNYSIMIVQGNIPYGLFKNENGIHRLVRISPFDSSGRRHTSFASVSVYKKEDDIKIEIHDSDLKIDTYKASGSGGQHVNTTDSAVRMTHIPTNTIVQCQSERSQHKNKATALNMLKQKLQQINIDKKNEKKNEQYNAQSSIEWGNQIRSYVLHPYQITKDTRSKIEYNSNNILSGNLTEMIYAIIRC